jgi:hypothetical protein
MLSPDGANRASHDPEQVTLRASRAHTPASSRTDKGSHQEYALNYRSHMRPMGPPEHDKPRSMDVHFGLEASVVS